MIDDQVELELRHSAIVLYHAGCCDGFTAWWISREALLQRGFSDEKIRGWSVHYGNEVPWHLWEDLDYAPEVYIVDFSYPADVLREIRERSSKLVVLDHHATAQESLAELIAEGSKTSGIELFFDMTKSGAVLAFEYFGGYADTVELVAYVEDRDLWNWKLPYSKEVNAVIQSTEFTLEAWDKLARREVIDLAEEGRVMLATRQALVDTVSRHYEWLELEGCWVPACNSSILQSEIGNQLMLDVSDAPFAVVWFAKGDSAVVSLRSTDQALDVSRIAKGYGGGGHRNAAGFKVDLALWVSWLAKELPEHPDK